MNGKLRNLAAAAAAALTIAASAGGASAASAGTRLSGDTDADGAVTVSDAQEILQAYTDRLSNKTIRLSAESEAAADVDCDNEITVGDAQLVLQFYTNKLAKKEGSFSALVMRSVCENTAIPFADPEQALFGTNYIRAAQDVKKMSLEEKVSQMFLISYPGYSTALQQTQGALCPAGYVLFANDFRNSTPASVRANMKKLKAQSRHGLMLGGDEEGGSVVRISMFTAFRSARFLSPQKLYQKNGLQAIFDDAKDKALFLKDLGLNYNLAPVVDMPKKSSSYIYSRTLGQDAKTTAAYSEGVVNVMNENTMIATLKHFPGYGDNLDTHTGVAVDKRTKKTFETEDFLPFVSGIRAGVPMIMVNHNIISCMDGTKPASLSEEVHRVLREELGFSGLIATDALTMQAVKKYASNGEAAVQAVLCGNDLILTTDYENQRKEVLAAVKDGRISEQQVNDAVRRVLACKYCYGLIP